ncbi:Holliday junction branch migration protein RuvA [Collinsella sp. AGMB00827]|uniref:Holliday junction branch migration complex subunit RuvA n=1 Tax=Collinsella ureilytica TaxID=2869515 RepID=A0ABS7MLK2_9ACTN|nr:Holliday junction branch migration protein RuvA [Collinsella urealyticum]
MISLLSGTLVEALPTSCVIDVAGVGYELGISTFTAASLPAVREGCRLYCRLVVREDALQLYGFHSTHERSQFDRLITVSGVGPRLALAVLSTLSTSQLYAAILAEDAKSLTRVPGIGKKTAQRLILELKSVLAKDGPPAGDMVEADLVRAFDVPRGSSGIEEAEAALLSMGFTPKEAELALKDSKASSDRVEDVLASALRRLGSQS